MTHRRTNLCALLCLASWLSVPGVLAAQEAARADTRPVLEITKDTVLDPATTCGRIVIKQSGVTIDGRGAWVIGATQGDPKDYMDVGVSASGVSHVTLKNLNVKGWQTGLKVEDGSEWLIEDCDFSDNFHFPAYGWHWGDNNRRGGIVLERVTRSTVRKSKANRVWDACALLDSDDNVIEGNDFSHTSNTCLWMSTACRNQIKKNNLSYGLRIAPGEVHARDSACVLVECGSNDNRFLDNDITHGGDGVFIRPMGNWVSRGNVFEGNDASYAHNNCFEAQCPGNIYRGNKANYGSHGIWIGISNDCILENNEVCYNGTPPPGHQNAPYTFKYTPNPPASGAGGIIFVGPSDHTICRGNKCIGNNGAGICMFGDSSPNPKYKSFHWVLENNVLSDNRWGIYMEFADWIDMAGNVFEKNRDGDIIKGGTATNITEYPDDPRITHAPKAVLDGPSSSVEGKEFVLEASRSTDPDGNKLSFRWDLGDGTIVTGPRVAHAYKAPGFYRVGLTVNNGRFSDLGWRNFRVTDACPEFGTEGPAADWSWEEVSYRDGLVFSPPKEATPPWSSIPAAPPVQPVPNGLAKVQLSDEKESFLAGKSSILVHVLRPSGNPISLLYPRSKNAGIPLEGNTRLIFWNRMFNSNLHSWQGLMPTITLYESEEKFAMLRPACIPANWSGVDKEERGDWMRRSILLAGDSLFKLEGQLPATLNYITIEFNPMGAAPMRVWIDAMCLRS